MLGVASFPMGHLVVLVGETNAEHSQEVVVSCLDINISLNEGLETNERYKWSNLLSKS